jgi:hypothetical protein
MSSGVTCGSSARAISRRAPLPLDRTLEKGRSPLQSSGRTLWSSGREDILAGFRPTDGGAGRKCSASLVLFLDETLVGQVVDRPMESCLRRRGSRPGTAPHRRRSSCSGSFDPSSISQMLRAEVFRTWKVPDLGSYRMISEPRYRTVKSARARMAMSKVSSFPGGSLTLASGGPARRSSARLLRSVLAMPRN